MCPHCRQNAPIVYRGVAAYCTACGTARLPLASSSVTLAGQPSRVGGHVARVLGWMVLGGGLLTAILVGLVAFLLFPDAIAWLVVSLPIALLSTAFAYMLLRSGRGLREMGEGEQKSARTKAIFALAANRGGALTAMDVARSLDLRAEDADALLTELAKTMPEQVAVEIDDAGGVYYRFPAILPSWQQPPGVRVEAAPTPTRVADAGVEADTSEQAPVPPTRQTR